MRLPLVGIRIRSGAGVCPRRTWTCALALVLTCTARAGAQDAQEPHETRVESARPVDADDDRVDVGAGTAWLTGAPEDVLARALGTTLVHEGGPLSPVRPMVRGLSGARLSVAVGGLALADPATGILDAALLPWAAAESVVVESGAGSAGALGGGMRLDLVRGPTLRARVLAGALSTARVSIAAADDTFLVAADAGTTRGDFVFAPTSAVAPVVTDDGFDGFDGFDGYDGDGDDDGTQVRGNNDHKRGSLLARALVKGGDVDVDALVLAAAHEGGIAGFAAAPTRGLRGEDAVGGARLGVTRRFAGGRVGAALQGRAAHRATGGPEDARSVVESGAVRAQTSLSLRDDVGGLDVVTGAAHASVLGAGQLVGQAGQAGRAGSRPSRTPFARTSADAGAVASTSLGPVRVRAGVDGALATDVGPLWGGELRAEAGDTWRAFVGVSRASRAPTLDELHAPRGLVNGNPALRPEALADVEVGAAVFGGRTVAARLVAFAGRIDDAIAYVNKNAFEIEPANVGSGWRAGVDVSTCVEVTQWLALDATGSVLASHLDLTGAPLPLAPPFASNVAIHVGARDGLLGTVAVRSRAAAPSNSFGTLEAAPYTLVDLFMRAPLSPNLALGLAVQNALDARDARDANGLPLPGLLTFLSLEVTQ